MASIDPDTSDAPSVAEVVLSSDPLEEAAASDDGLGSGEALLDGYVPV